MHSLIQDLRHFFRQLIKDPAFALTASFSLALGIAATTAVFSVIYAALIDPFPYRDVDRVVRVTLQDKSGPIFYTSLDARQVRQLRHVPVVESMLVMGFRALTLTGPDVPANVWAIDLIPTGFADLGDPPILGRGIGPADAPEGQEPLPVAVLSYKFWQRQFLGDPQIVGKTLQLDRKNYTIVGVAGPRFVWYMGDVYLPLRLAQDPAVAYTVNLRLKPGVSLRAADAALDPLLQQFAKETPKRFPDHFKTRVERLNEWVMRGMSGTLFLLFAAVGLLLAIGCGNVSILLLARGTARQQELALRLALGANRRRIVRQLLTESLLLSGIGVALGIAMSYGLLGSLKALLPRYAFAPEVVVRINLPVLAFSVAAALATGVLFGLWPALRLSRAAAGQAIQSGARRVAGSVHGRRTYSALIAGQIALTLLLLAGAGSALEAFLHLMRAPLGYDPHNVLSLAVPLHDNTYTTWAARTVYFERLRAKVAETPGVTVTALSIHATPPRSGFFMRFEIFGQPSAGQPRASINMISSEYFAALRIPLAAGRLWNETECRNGAHVALVNRTLARRYFPAGDAVGRSLKLPEIEERPPEVLAAPHIAESWLEIVGIVEDARNDGVANPVTPAIYVPYSLQMGMRTEILVRAAVSPLTLLHGLRAQLAAVNPQQQALSAVDDLETWISDDPEWYRQHLTAWIFAIFAGLALALAAVGLFSVVSYTVARRANEFGIRMALGARPAHVLRMVFASTASSVTLGIVVGLALSLALNRLLGQWVQGIARDPLIVLAGILLLTLVAAMACFLPAWRASRADPAAALRC